MKVTAVLCNHAEALNNLLYVAGAGIDHAWVPPGSPAPYSSTLAIGILVEVPWTATNQQHKVEVDFLDQDMNPVELPTGPDGGTMNLHVESWFNVGRPPTLTPGDTQSFAVAINIPALILNELGRYVFVVKLDGNPEAELPWTLAPMPNVMLSSGGAAGIPRMQ